MITPFIILLAITLDFIVGEPRKYHPLVGFGYLAIRYEKYVNTSLRTPTNQFLFGFIGVVILVIPFFLLAWVLLQVTHHVWLIDVLILYWAIGHQSLRQHIVLVRDALNAGDFELARQRVAMIVSRDTAQLNETQIIGASVETGLENGSDAIFAPLFWFCVLGAPAVVVYRLVNTLDAMWGYKTERFLYFGKAAARLDDVLNYIPARLVAISYALLGNTREALSCWKQQASSLKSPNAGPVMVSGAGSLNIQLGGPTFYHGELLDKPYFGTSNTVSIDDIQRSLNLITHTLCLWLVAIALIAIVVHFSF